METMEDYDQYRLPNTAVRGLKQGHLSQLSLSQTCCKEGSFRKSTRLMARALGILVKSVYPRSTLALA
jgi:hypothetical protein